MGILVWFEEACFLHSWQQYLVCLQSPLEVTMEQIRYENSWLMYERIVIRTSNADGNVELG